VCSSDLVRPALSFWSDAIGGSGGDPLPEDFEYSSGNEDLLMPMDDLRALIEAVTSRA